MSSFEERSRTGEIGVYTQTRALPILDPRPISVQSRRDTTTLHTIKLFLKALEQVKDIKKRKKKKNKSSSRVPIHGYQCQQLFLFCTPGRCSEIKLKTVPPLCFYIGMKVYKLSVLFCPH